MRWMPISRYQNRFFLDWKKRPDNMHNVSIVYKLKGGLNKVALKRACELFIQNNDIVHAKFSVDGESCSYIDFGIDDIYQEREFDTGSPMVKQLRDLLDITFDLTAGKLLRIYLINIPNKNEFIFVLSNVHHVISDGEYMLQIVKQVQLAYNTIIRGEEPNIKTQSFFKAIEKEQELLTQSYIDEAKQFWLSFIGDTPVSINLPYKDAHVDKKDRTGSFIYFFLDGEEKKKLKKIAKKNNTTLFGVLVAVFSVIIYRYSKQKNFMLSFPINVRPPGFGEVVGCFITNNLFKLEFDKISGFKDLLSQLTEQRKVIKKHSRYMYLDLINDQINLGKKAESMFNANITQTYLNSEGLALDGVINEQLNIPWSSNVSNEMSLYYDDDSPNKIKFRFQYRKALFDSELMEKLVKDYRDILENIISFGDLDYPRKAS
ncbi:condensation domain-containing protein [Pseudofrancisella aestuarii]|uniref:Condensation domain-containing protein n=1 Tax=Pseudofrancisella aestuarii TaxID=2670347 RepID=A0ABV9TCF2_9GAMM|nr:condensation domain-containing protein [Pseudofrancisella aestuarii]